MTASELTIEVPVADNAAIGLELPTITDDYMQSRLTGAQSYALLILKKTPKYSRPAADPVVWEHGRRNMALRQSGLMPIVCPARDDSDLAGIGIFTVSPERAAEIVSEDPGVKAGIFSFEVHPLAVSLARPYHRTATWWHRVTCPRQTPDDWTLRAVRC